MYHLPKFLKPGTQFNCLDPSSFQAVLDDAFIKVAPFFADGFESGNTSAWSSAVP